MKINEVLSELEGVLNHGRKSKDFRFDSRQLYYMLLKHRAELLRQMTEKSRVLNERTYSLISGIDLEATSLYGIPCYTNGCIYKRSVSEFPELVNNRYSSIIKDAVDAEGNSIPYGTFETQKYDKYSLTKKNTPQTFILDNHLYVIHNTDIASITVLAVVYDPLKIYDVQRCGEVTTCYDPMTTEFPVEKSILRTIYGMVYEEIFGVSMKIPIDTVPDAKTPLAQKG